jgi:hypothetical protein
MRIYQVDGNPVIIESDAKAEELYPGRWAFLREQAEPPAVRRITQLAFLTRFTDAEAIAIDLASIGATVQAASVRRYVKKVDAATFIDLAREDTRQGVLALEASGLLAAGRALEILDAPVQDAERFNG